jgi:hypothetical protein
VHPHLPHLPAAALLLSVVHAAAIAVALTAPGANTLAGMVVLAGLVSRWALRHRSRSRIPMAAVLPAEAALSPTPARPA